MRKIKFRVWDGNLMHNVSELHFCMGPKLDGNGLKFYGPGVGQGWVDGKNVHLMQYTGLKDKNGKEIYEGDILKIVSNFELREDMQNQAVTYKEGFFSTYEWALFELLRNRKDRKQTFEIIGNIYENPELLEESK
ncbi:YopX family protein [Bacillus thuringiensis]|uniref:YopX family protein n=1 Tax=Bacillus thuringiensis TaxID=1428 RepID=UPI003459A010